LARLASSAFATTTSPESRLQASAYHEVIRFIAEYPRRSQRDPAMFGGPFAALPPSAVDAAKLYIEHTERRRADALAFVGALKDFEHSVQSQTGFSLDGTRQNMPSILKGRIELAYTLANHPRVRLLEEMFEEDDMGYLDSQELLLHATPDNDRPFFLSTPRLFISDSVRLRTPFSSEATEILARARTEAIDLLQLSTMLDRDANLLSQFFAEEPGRKRARYTGDGVRASYFGHACILIETNDISILLDPTAAYDAGVDADHLRLEDLPEKIDIVLISHGHHDHFCTEMLIQLRHRVDKVIIPPSNTGEPSERPSQTWGAMRRV
jgi:hypothetical protein